MQKNYFVKNVAIMNLALITDRPYLSDFKSFDGNIVVKTT